MIIDPVSFIPALLFAFLLASAIVALLVHATLRAPVTEEQPVCTSLISTRYELRRNLAHAQIQGKRDVRLASARLTVFTGLLLVLLVAPLTGQAQDSQTAGRRPVQVWLQQNIDAAGRDRLRFVDRRNGDELHVDLPGERYTPLLEQVLYFDLEERRVRLVNAAGEVSDHPFIQLPGATLRVDWLVSADASRIAWTFTEQGADGQLRSFTRVADIQGADVRDVLVDGPRPERHALPVAFSGDGATLFMDYRPLLQAGETQRAGFADLFALALDEGFTRPLPDEPGCLCGAAFGAGQVIRLQLAADLDGYELVRRDLNGDLRGRIAAPTLPGFTRRGLTCCWRPTAPARSIPCPSCAPVMAASRRCAASLCSPTWRAAAANSWANPSLNSCARSPGATATTPSSSPAATPCGTAPGNWT